MKLTYVFIVLVAAAYDETFMVEAYTAPSAEVRQQIVDHHNEVRNNVEQDIGVSASNMMKMHYDTSLEETAGAWADKCIYYHSGDAAENLYYRSAYTSTERATFNFIGASRTFAGEKTWYKYGGDNSKYTVGHYTQQIWWNNDRIGCAGQFCPELTDRTTGEAVKKSNIQIVCHYAPGGNYVGQKPFIAGPPNCAETDPIYTNLCSPCKEKLPSCNDGTWNGATCKCDCPADGYKYLSDCNVDCKVATNTYEEDETCLWWKHEGHCTTSKTYMKENCLYTCFCSTADYYDFPYAS